MTQLLSILQIGRFKDHSSKKKMMFTTLKLKIYFAFRVLLMPVPSFFLPGEVHSCPRRGYHLSLLGISSIPGGPSHRCMRISTQLLTPRPIYTLKEIHFFKVLSRFALLEVQMICAYLLTYCNQIQFQAAQHQEIAYTSSYK